MSPALLGITSSQMSVVKRRWLAPSAFLA